MLETPDPESFDDPGPLDPQPPSRARRLALIAVVAVLIASMVFLAFVSGRGLVSPAPVRPEQPAGSPDVPIARLAVVDAAGALTTTDLKGNARHVGTAGLIYSFPVWSPSGDRIAVIGQDGPTMGVFVAPLAPTSDTDVQRSIYTSVDEPPFYVSWSPDGHAVGFLTSEGDGLALRAAPADGSGQATIVRHGSPMYWAWTPAGGMLVHSGGDTPDAFFGEVDAGGVSLEPTVLPPGGFRAPAVSTDGAFRAYVGPGEATSDQIVVERRTGAGRRVADIHGAAGLGFSPTGSDLAFIAPDRAGQEVALPVGPLRLMDPDSGAVRMLLTGPVVAFFWAPDGRTIAALQIARPPDDTIVRTPGSGMVILAGARHVATDPGVTLGLVFVDAASGDIVSQRVVQVGDVFAQQVLPYFDQYALSHRIWSPDGRSLALPVMDEDGITGIDIIPADGGARTRVADGVAAAWEP
jgi:TolB protein